MRCLKILPFEVETHSLAIWCWFVDISGAVDWREDMGPKRNPVGSKNLALIRNALIQGDPAR